MKAENRLDTLMKPVFKPNRKFKNLGIVGELHNSNLFHFHCIIEVVTNITKANPNGGQKLLIFLSNEQNILYLNVTILHLSVFHSKNL